MKQWRWAAIGLVTAVFAIAFVSWIARDSASDGAAAQTRLTIYSTTDLAEFGPVIENFRELHPEIDIDYLDLDAMPLYERFREEHAAGRHSVDVMLSSAMDLQIKLVNDGFAAPHRSANSQSLPAWASWREEAFGFTFEPVVMVYNSRAMAGRALPQSRDQLLNAIRNDPEFWYEAIGTYDISASSVGYLIASQDARLNGNFSALLKAFGDVRVQVADNTSTILEQIRSGQLKAGYNLLGSYARRLIDAGAPLTIVYPKDYTLALLRTAVIPENAPNPESAHLFLDYLLSLRGQQVLESQTGLSAIRNDIAGRPARFELSDAEAGTLRPIALGPGLLVYLDALKRRRLLENWSSLVRKPAESPQPS